MANMTLYHGSDHMIEKPLPGAGKIYNDYGQGFYCTEDVELAKEWACATERGGFCNRYELKLDRLQILDLNAEEYTVLNWIAILAANRIVNYRTGMEKRAAEFLVKHYLPDTRGVDVIKGYRADDSYFSFARAFFGNAMTVEQLEKVLRLGDLGQQICLKSEKAFASLSFVGVDCVEDVSYHQRRNKRNADANRIYNEILSGDSDGKFINDIMREERRR